MSTTAAAVGGAVRHGLPTTWPTWSSIPSSENELRPGSGNGMPKGAGLDDPGLLTTEHPFGTLSATQGLLCLSFRNRVWSKAAHSLL